jgi:uncharacterized membrane protein
MHPFDLKTALLANRAQHVVLILFPIALFITGVAFAVCAQRLKRPGMADAACLNFLVATFSTLPVLASGLLGLPVAARRDKN